MFLHTGSTPFFDRVAHLSIPHVIRALLGFFAFNFNYRPGLNVYLKSDQGWINFTVGLRTETGSIRIAVCFENGRVKVLSQRDIETDVTLFFATEKAASKLLSATPTEQIFMLLKSELRTEGNTAYMNLFFFF